MLRIERDGHITLLVLDNPPRNELTIEGLAALPRLVSDALSEPGVAAIILASASADFFSAGASLADPDSLRDPGYLARNAEAFSTAARALREAPVPTIAAINGLAFGGGLELALCCDSRVAEQQAIFSFPECRLGFTPCGGGTLTLPALVGPAWARRMILLGEHVNAERALAIGLIDEAVPRGQCRIRARSIARFAAEQSPNAMRACKRLLSLEPSEAAWDQQRDAFVAVSTSPEAAEGLNAFLERRAPVWSAR